MSAPDRPAGSWSADLWRAMAPAYDAILGHPFLHGLVDGSLPEDCFAFYVAQDAHYLRDYARALALVASKAPTHALAGTFAGHAANTAAVELALHATLLPELGLDPAALDVVPRSPTTTAYVSYLLATCGTGSYAEALAVVLPCYWIYERVGAALVGRGSPDPRYQRWIDTYAGEDFAAVVAEVLDAVDDAGQQLAPAAAADAQRHAVTAARYEWMFWDAAWRREQWPLDVTTGAP